MSNSNSSKQVLLSVIGIAILVIAVVGVAFAFFNYTRTGVANSISVGRIYFNTEQNGSINLTNMFPIEATPANLSDNTKVGIVTIDVVGDTTYDNGIEYLVSAVDVNNTVISGSNEKALPISIDVSYGETSGETIGTLDNNYFTNRGGNTSIYKVLAKDTIKEDSQLVVGYIAKGAIGIDGTITIKAYLDKDKILISDTYPSEDVTHTESSGETSIEVVDYTNGTPNSMAEGKTVFTTTEWNSLHTNGVSFKIKVEANEGTWVEDNRGVTKVKNAILVKQNATTNSCNPVWIDDNGTSNDESDDITYFSGTNDCVDMNYVWYSGKLWRITAIYPDGAMKLITQNNITSIASNALDQVDFYTDANTTSYMYQWLNEDFYDTLYNVSNFIDTTKQWNATMPVDTTISTKPLETNMVSANVGLLNNYEYYNSYRCISSTTCTGSTYVSDYLNIGYYWWLLNPYSASRVWFVYNSGYGGNSYPTGTYGVRPSIYLKSEIEFTGEGTSTNPYKIVGDKDIGNTNELINTRLSGEYVKLDNVTTNQLFRIIGVEDNKTKIIAMDYAENKNIRDFSTNINDTLWGSGTTADTDTWYTYLNTPTTGYLDTLKTTYGELFDNGPYYLGTNGFNFKLSVCANTTSGNTKVCDKTNDKGTFTIGLPRYGEMFATQQGTGYSNSINMWLINRYSADHVWVVYNSGHCNNNYPTYTNGARPTLHLKSTVKILSGSGTESDPYVVGL